MSIRPTPTDSTHKERLLRYVQRGPAAHSCWRWIGSKKRHGYGRIRINWIEYTASRLSWAVHNKRDPGEFDVCHSCDNPECCNPAHLFLGTHSENIKDAHDKGRQMGFRSGSAPNKGEANPQSKLTQAKADEIRALYKAGGVTYSDLAHRFGVGVSAIGKVVSGQRWVSPDYLREAASALEFDDLGPRWALGRTPPYQARRLGPMRRKKG